MSHLDMQLLSRCSYVEQLRHLVEVVAQSLYPIHISINTIVEMTFFCFQRTT